MSSYDQIALLPIDPEGSIIMKCASQLNAVRDCMDRAPESFCLPDLHSYRMCREVEFRRFADGYRREVEEDVGRRGEHAVRREKHALCDRLHGKLMDAEHRLHIFERVQTIHHLQLECDVLRDLEIPIPHSCAHLF